jgi:hypothetical protein
MEAIDRENTGFVQRTIERMYGKLFDMDVLSSEPEKGTVKTPPSSARPLPLTDWAEYCARLFAASVPARA